MTAFKLKKKESEADGIRRVAHERAEDAVERLRDEDADQVEAVHEARKDMKKLRATLKLVRPVIDEQTYSRENERFRDAGRALSDARDAQVRLPNDRRARRALPGRAARRGWWARARGTRRRRAGERRARGRAGAQRRPRSQAATLAIDDWPLERRRLRPPAAGPEARLRPRAQDLPLGAQGAQRRGAARVAQAVQGPLVSRCGSCVAPGRRSRRDRRRGPRALRPAGRRPRPRRPRRAISTRSARSSPPSSASSCGAARDTRRAELQDEAFAYGERLLAEKPKRFVARLERYWRA